MYSGFPHHVSVWLVPWSFLTSCVDGIGFIGYGRNRRFNRCHGSRPVYFASPPMAAGYPHRQSPSSCKLGTSKVADVLPIDELCEAPWADSRRPGWSAWHLNVSRGNKTRFPFAFAFALARGIAGISSCGKKIMFPYFPCYSHLCWHQGRWHCTCFVACRNWDLAALAATGGEVVVLITMLERYIIELNGQ